jgi:2-polyprenyl-3-methyl-5-hydroxy-6-metoxy-1,4-benzoquinol methylase
MAHDRVKYCVLDVTENAEAQGYTLGSYDVIVAANVLHATQNFTATISNVRRLLKPEGKLILIEMTAPENIETGFIFGTLAGWWLSSEEFRQQSALVDEDA